MARQKRQATAGDMVRSLLIILVPLLIITFVFTRNTEDHPVEAVDPAPVLTQARQEAPYPVLMPTNLPAEWIPTRVAWEPEGYEGAPPRQLWQIGYLSPDRIYLAVNQSPDTDTLVGPQTRDGVPDGESTIGDTAWERRISPDGRTRSLVSITKQVSTVIVGDTDYAALEAFAGTLQTG
ncbi:DUF4245 domain-containing protein [Microlunatus sp. GCM10028923]|uniref:DUF4245 domain-containing protein n=1 Tax=Microlunatus sp. GCM10028923 TaxID=3273400 RepID=UPI0036089084